MMKKKHLYTLCYVDQKFIKLLLAKISNMLTFDVNIFIFKNGFQKEFAII